MIRIWAGFAVSPERFAFSIGELRDEDPQSIILMYNARHETNWGYADLPRTIKSMTAVTDPGSGKPVFVPMSNEGDVYFLTGDIPVEKIGGAGVLSDDAEGFGSMSHIASDNGKLFACGYGSQLYERRAAEDWVRLCDKTMPGLANCAFFGMAIRAGSGPVALCGMKRPTYVSDGPGENKIVETPVSAALYLRRSGWVEVPNEFAGGFNACIETPLGVVAVGDHGAILRAAAPDEGQDISQPGLMANLYSVEPFRGGYSVLGQNGIHLFDAEFRFLSTLALPQGLTLPNRHQVLGEDIILFDYAGVALWRDDTWFRVPVPPDLWALATT